MAQSRSHKSQSRNYRKEYDNYQGTPEQIHKRAMRNAARREYEKSHGDLPRNVDVDHAQPLAKGGSNAPSNLRTRTQSANRSFARTKTARMK